MLDGENPGFWQRQPVLWDSPRAPSPHLQAHSRPGCSVWASGEQQPQPHLGWEPCTAYAERSGSPASLGPTQPLPSRPWAQLSPHSNTPH